MAGAACLLMTLAVWCAVPGAARAAPRVATATAARPSQAVAYARIAVVRVLAKYEGIDSSLGVNVSPVPCAADGVLVGTTGANSYTYALVPTAAVAPLTPCQQAQAGYEQFWPVPQSWQLFEVDVLLDAAYTGTSSSQIGSISYSVPLSAIQSDGGPTAPPLLAVQLSGPSGMPTHDLPVLSLPQPSDAPATGSTEMLDLTGPTGSLLASTAIPPTSVVYPVDLSSEQIVPPAAGVTPTTSSSSGSGPTASQLSLGAPAIDSNGRLVGMIVADANGNHVFAGVKTMNAAIGSVSGKSGLLMSGWQQGLGAFYASPPQYAQAAQAFSALHATYPDFGGVGPFLSAARSSSATIPPLTQAAPTPTPPGNSGGGASLLPGTLALLIGMGLAVVILVLGIALALVVRVRGRRAAAAAARVPPEELGLDLLPRESMYRPLDIADAPTAQMPAIPSQPVRQPTRPREYEPAVAEIVRAGPTGPRQPTTLMPHAAGLTDAGVRRASHPNQDNIFALEGTRPANGRAQPYGVFIVADGMGGHEHGQEASALAIELLAREIERGLSGAQALDERTLTSLLREGIRQAHAALRQRNSVEHADMGTTITAALVVDDVAYVANVGDSRTYVMSPDTGLRQITTDHSVVASLVAAGVIRPDEIYTHPRRNQIYRSLGGDQGEVEIDTFIAPLQAGDKLLLCSDGLWEMVRDPRIDQILRATADPRQAVELLVREANANGGEDNISAIVVRMVEEMPEQARLGARLLASPTGARAR